MTNIMFAFIKKQKILEILSIFRMGSFCESLASKMRIFKQTFLMKHSFIY